MEEMCRDYDLRDYYFFGKGGGRKGDLYINIFLFSLLLLLPLLLRLLNGNWGWE